MWTNESQFSSLPRIPFAQQLGDLQAHVVTAAEPVVNREMMLLSWRIGPGYFLVREAVVEDRRARTEPNIWFNQRKEVEAMSPIIPLKDFIAEAAKGK